jgi:predicted transcriptional regulator
MQLVITEKQLQDLIRLRTQNQDINEEGEEGAPEAGTSSDGEKKTNATKWESGVTRGPANQIGVTKWSDTVGSSISRGKANPLNEADVEGVKILRPDGKVMIAPLNTQILDYFTSNEMDGSVFKNSLKTFMSKERGGVGNEYTQKWLPNDWSNIIKVNSVSKFRSPDGSIFMATFNHPGLNAFAKNKGTWDDFYKLTPDPKGWRFAGYYNGQEAFVGLGQEKSFWDEWKYWIMGGASIVATILIPGVGGILVGIGIDLVSAGFQYAEGDSVGAGVSVILAFIPVIGKAIPGLKVSNEVAEKLAKEFAPLTSKEQLITKMNSLPEQEKYFMQKLLSEDPKKLEKIIQKEIATKVTQTNSINVVKRLNTLVKKGAIDKAKAETLFKSLDLRRFGFDIAASGLVVGGGFAVQNYLNKKASEQFVQGIMPDKEDIKIAEMAQQIKTKSASDWKYVILPTLRKYAEVYDVPNDEAKLNKLRNIQKTVLTAYLQNPDQDFEELANEVDKKN